MLKKVRKEDSYIENILVVFLVKAETHHLG